MPPCLHSILWRDLAEDEFAVHHQRCPPRSSQPLSFVSQGPPAAALAGQSAPTPQSSGRPIRLHLSAIWPPPRTWTAELARSGASRQAPSKMWRETTEKGGVQGALHATIPGVSAGGFGSVADKKNALRELQMACWFCRASNSAPKVIKTSLYAYKTRHSACIPGTAISLFMQKHFFLENNEPCLPILAVMYIEQ